MIVTQGFVNTSGGPDCECRYCVHMSPAERMIRGLQIHDAKRRAGQIRAAMPSATLARSKGFAATMEKHPEMLRALRHKIKSHNRRRAAENGVTPAQYKKARLAQLHEIYQQA